MVLIQYLVKLSISLGVVWLFYQFVLRRLTFYNANRWYLLGYTLLCFFIPLIDISPVLQKNEWSDSTAVAWVPLISNYDAGEIISPGSENFFTVRNMVCLALVGGMVIMFFRLLFQLISFSRMMKKAKAIPGGEVNLFQVDENIIPFSFGNSIFLNQHLHTAEELQEIIRHEFVHVKQKHSLDIIWGEILCLVNWYNPFAWLLKRSIRQNLEFIADNKVLENGIDKKQYQYLLLKVIGNNQFSIAPKFNFSSLKKRIAMMNKLKTAKLHLVRFLFILPLLAVILLSFRKQIGSTLSAGMKQEASFKDTVPEKEWNPMPTESETDFIRRHPAIKNISWGYILSVQRNDAGLPGKAGDAIMTMYFKNGKWDMYNLGIPSDVEKFKKNYGEKPPIPPPYTASHEPNSKGYYLDIADDKGNCTVVVKNGEKEIDRVLLNTWKKNPGYYERKYGELVPEPPAELAVAVAPVVALELPENVQAMEVSNERVEVRLKDGKQETFNLQVPVEKAAFEKKYGEMPPEPTVLAEATIPAVELNAVRETNRTRIGEHFEINEKNQAYMRLKDGTVEEYDLNNSEQRKKFELKYGKIIEVSPKTIGAEEPVKVIGTLEGEAVIAPKNIEGPGEVLFLNAEGKPISGEEDVLVTITKKTTREQLDLFVRQMKEKDIELTFDKIEYNNGILVSISGTMKYKGGTNSFSVTDFNKVRLSRVKDGDHIYLKVDTRDHKTVS